jgi:TPR repeat protein
VKSIVLILALLATTLWSSENNLREGVLAYNQKSYDKAKQYFELAITKDESANAAYLLGKMYLYGEGVSVDLKKAIEYLDFARDNGNIPSGCYLSEAYMNAKTNTSYVAYGLMKGLKQKIPHCQKMLERYFVYKDF